MTAPNIRETTWNKKAEEHQLGWRRQNNILLGQNGKQNDVERDYILPADQWLLGIWEPIRDSLSNYLIVDEIQANQGKHNLKSS